MAQTKITFESSSQKEKMLNVARRLFWQQGYTATGMRDIAEAYDCKPANIYNFFANKEEILFEVLREELQEIIDPIMHLEDDDSSSPVEQLRSVIENHLKVSLSYRRSAKTLFDVALDNLSAEKRKQIVNLRDTYDQIIRKVIQRGIEAGCFTDMDPKLVGFMVASMITRTRVWFHPKKGMSVSELADFIFNFTMRGLSA